MKILLIEDDQEIANFLKNNLEQKCFAVDTASDGERGLFLATTNDYDVIVMDYFLPKIKGCQICQEIRKEKNTVPILVLSVQAEVEDKVNLLNLGADDYLAKPFSFEELLARINALLRRPRQLTEEVLRVEDLILDTKKYLVKRGTKKITLTRKEFMLLEYLMKNKNTVVSRASIMEHIWDSDLDPFSNTIETHILTLRRKINLPNKKKFVQTVSGMGYKIV